MTILGLGQRHWLAMPPRLTEDADFLKGDTPWAVLCAAVAQMGEDTDGN